MSGWHIAVPDDLARLWPAARTSHVADSLAELDELYAAGPWRVRVARSGDAMVVDRWRHHRSELAIRAAWVAEHRVRSLVEEAQAVARAQGFDAVLSPLLARSLHGPYEAAGMREVEPIVALQGAPGVITRTSAGPGVREAVTADVEAILRVDAASFDDFWRYGTEEVLGLLGSERVVVASGDGAVQGYASARIRRGTCTLGRLAVEPEARRRGVGAALVGDVARWAAEKGAIVVSLCTQESNSASRSLYEACGLIEVDERFGLLRTTA